MSPLTRGWVVAFSGLGINLALGVLYTWSVIAGVLTRSAAEGGLHHWTAQQAMWPYAFAVGCFALTMVFAGRLQDRFGPRWVATAGGAMVGIGMIVASLSPTRLVSAEAFPFRMVLGFGVCAGVGIGLAYASTTPAAVKWFSAGRRGLATGIVVAGFGLAPLYTAPLTAALIRAYGINESFLFLGIISFVVISGLAQLVADPPKGFVPPGSYSEVLPSVSTKPAAREYAWREMVRSRSYYVMWAMFACAACAGLMVMGVIGNAPTLQLGPRAISSPGYVLIAALALGNGVGRPLSGLISDRIGRQHTMLGVFASQAVLLAVLRFASSFPLLAFVVFLIGLAYGASLTLFPATTFDFFGTAHGGANYGLVFTAWGVGGLLGTLLASWGFGWGRAASAPVGTHGLAFTIAAGLCAFAAGLTFLLRPPTPSGEHSPVSKPGAARQA